MIKLMKFLFLIILFTSCKNETENIKLNFVNISQNDNLEKFIDSTNFGLKGKYKLEITQKKNDSSINVNFILFKKTKQKWINIQDYNLNKCCEIPLITEFSDFNNDGFNDFTIHFATAGRGANDVRKLFLFSNNSESFLEIKNSDLYPNLRYNKKLDCIDAFSVYAGTTTTFLKIKNDSLVEFARVDFMDGKIKSYSIEEGKETKLKTKVRIGEIHEIVRFSDYNPIKESQDY